jgi:CrcB protein
LDTYTIALIGLGGVVGAVSRYLLSGWFQNNTTGFPYGTLFINFTGALALSVIMYLSEYSSAVPVNARVFLTVGLLGAYTTMSTFGFESFRLLEHGETLNFAIYFLATNGLVLMGVFVGKVIALRFASIII